MKRDTNAVQAAAAMLVLAGGIGSLLPVHAADVPSAPSGYVTDGNGNLVSDGSNRCVGDASLAEGNSRTCDESAPATSASEPKKPAPASEA